MKPRRNINSVLVKDRLRKVLIKAKLIYKKVVHSLAFVLVVFLHVLFILVMWIAKRRFFRPILKLSIVSKISRQYQKIIEFIDPEIPNGFNRTYLVELSVENMKAKRTRTIVTMGGMATSVAFIVFLVSIGYGLQSMVVTRVTKLGELKQTEVVPGLTSELSLNDSTLAKFSKISNVKSVLPLIAVVGKISYQQSISDMAVYGVTSEYLSSSALQPVKGKVFEKADTISRSLNSDVLGDTTDINSYSLGDEIGNVDYEIVPDSWIKVRKDSSLKSEILGYTRRIEGKQSGSEHIGGYYETSDKSLTVSVSSGDQASKWIQTKVPIWEKTTCDQTNDSVCEDGQYIPIMNDQGGQRQVDGYISEISIKKAVDIANSKEKILGITTDNNASGLLPLVNIASESGAQAEAQRKVVDLPSQAQRVAVVNRAVLRVLGLKEDEAVGKKIMVSFVVVSDLAMEQKDNIESTPAEYSISGVTPDEDTPIVYVPFMDLRSLGINKFSQIKIIVSNQNDLSKVRASIEAGGYGTVSVADTVTQIDKLFTSLRLVLAILGMVALFVAALGMFNTLTVSLLERTREVGLMKAMGMKSSEVSELFLSESMIMGFFGGVVGLIIGIVTGKFLSLILTIFSLSREVGVVDISFVPPVFVFIVLLLSSLVGIATGYYPAKRATQISALNALRYE